MKPVKIILLTLISLSLSFCVLKSKYEQLDVSAQSLSKRTAELTAENDTLKKELSEKNMQNEKLTMRNEELSSINQLLVEKNKTLASANTEQTRKSIKLQDELVKKEEKLTEVTKTYTSLAKDLKKEIDNGNITIEELKGMLKLNVVSAVLFKSGSDEILDGGKKILDKVAESLVNVKDKRIEIQGHTDDREISGKLKSKYPSNWELSAARATQVVRYLQLREVNPEFLSAGGYSSFHPIASNETENGRAKNRRIEIVLLPILPK